MAERNWQEGTDRGGAQQPVNVIEIPDLNGLLPEDTFHKAAGARKTSQHTLAHGSNATPSAQNPEPHEIHIPQPQDDDGDGYGAQPLSFRLGDPVSQNGTEPAAVIEQRQASISAKQKQSYPNYTLNIMVRQFTKLAERKLNLCLNSVPLDQEPNIIEILSEGVDPTFDRVITSLGYIARRKPKSVTDAVMHWRRGKSELREMARAMLEKDMMQWNSYKNTSTPQTHKKSSSRSSRSTHDSPAINSDAETLRQLEQKVQKSKITFTQADRQFTISTYILWRVLIEVVRQTPTQTLIEETGLEEIMYNYLRNIDPYLVSQSIIHSSNWNLLAGLIGQMSEKSFLSVSDRFIADLEKFPKGYTDGSDVSESRLNLLIHGMRYLQFSNSSLERFEEGADFMKSLAKFFYRCENDNLLNSYCDVINQLLLSLAETLTAEVNHPTWVDAVTMIFNKSVHIATAKPPKLWNYAATLVATAVSVAPKTLFDREWLKIVNMYIRRLKPKLPTEEKVVITKCLARLIWAYLYRYSDTLNAKTRNLESIANQLFQGQQNKKQQWITHDSLLIQATVQTLRAMAYSQLNFTLENIVLPILKSSFNGTSLESISHEKVILCIRTYACILSDYKSKERPPFPTDYVIHSSLDPMEFCNNDNKEIFDANSSNSAVHEEVSSLFISLLFLLDQQVGCKTLDGNIANVGAGSGSSAGTTSSTPTLPLKISQFYFHQDGYQAKNLELFSTVISVVSWCLSSNSSQYRRVIELLVKNTIHEDENVSAFSTDMLKILMTKKNPNVIMTVFARTAFYLDEKAASLLNHEYVSSTEYVKLLEIYVDLLQCWLEFLAETHKGSLETPNEMYNVNHGFVQEEIQETKPFEDLELKTIVTIIDEVEGNGLFFLFSHDFRVRFLGSQILRIIAQFDEVIYDLTSDTGGAKDPEEDSKKVHNRMPSKFAAEFGTRVIHVLESLDFFEFIGPKKPILSEAESKRLARLQHKQRKDTIIRLAESNHGVDAALWFKVFEEILDSLVRRCPIQIAIARSHSCIRLVQLYDQLVSISLDPNSKSVSSLIWDYMLCLKIACSSLTSTSEQRLHIPAVATAAPTSSSIYAPLTKSHMRKRSQQLFTVQHQKITSAKSIFKMTVPLLTATNTKLKEALVEGLSCLNVNIFNSFLESIESILEGWAREQHPAEADLRLRVEITGVLNKVIAKFYKIGVPFLDDTVSRKLQYILENNKAFLSRPESQTNFELHRLRKYFCGLLETFHSECLKLDQVDRWLPFKFRRESFEFMDEWCGYGKDTSLFNERYRRMTEQISRRADAVTLQASLELQKRQLQYSAISCMANLCCSPIATEKDSFNIPKVLDWIDSLFNTYTDKIIEMARRALLQILVVSTASDEILDQVINKCYTHDPALDNYFVTLSEAFVKGAKFREKVHRPLALGLFACGSDNISVRTAAASLLEHTEMKFYETNKSAAFIDGICCRSRVIYKRTLFQLSTHFATAHPEDKYMMISELTMLFHIVGSSPRRDILAVLLPWVQTVELTLAPDHPDRHNSLMVLYNFFEITVKFAHKMQNEVEALWVALANGTNKSNVDEIYRFIVEHSLEMKNTVFWECSRQVISCLATIPAGVNLVDTLISNLEPKSMIPVEKLNADDTATFEDESQITHGLPYVAQLAKIAQTTKGVTAPSFSLCELSVIFLSDLLLTPSENVKANLSLLLHLAFVLLDDQLAIVQDQACAMLIHLLRQYGDDDAGQCKRIIDSLRSHDRQKRFWTHGDLGGDKNGGRIPENMDALVRNVMHVFEKTYPGIQQDWSRTALAWATSCKVMHIAARSFQIFRCLISFLDLGMLRDMLLCLANTVSDENPGIQSFSMQILMTLNAITAELYSEQLIDFPQLFWSVVACLNTVHENEFIEVLSTLSKFISKIDLDSDETVECLIATFPPNWEGRFEGLQPLVMMGLRSANAYEPTIRLLDRLNLLKDSAIIGSGQYRILLALLANIPRFLHAQTTKRFGDDVVDAANVLCAMADRADMGALSRILDSLIKKKFRNKEDFMSQVVSVIKRYFFPEYSAQTLVFLLGLLFNNTAWIKLEMLDFLKHVFKAVDLTDSKFVGLGADLVSPLLRLLMTDYVDLALEVLDEANSISASPFDKHYLMMSSGDASMRREYEKVATLFGIPDESGWSVPIPAVSTARTRNNIHSVFSTCVVSTAKEGDEQPEPPVEPEFNRDDYVHYSPAWPDQREQSLLTRQQSSLQDDESAQDQNSLSHMLATLENLDSFFTKENMDLSGAYGHQYNGSVDTRSTAGTSVGQNNWGLTLDSPQLDQNMQFPSTASFKTLMGDSSATPANFSVSSFRNSARLNMAVPMQLNSKSASNYSSNMQEISSPLGSPMVSGQSPPGEEYEGLFRFEILRPSSKVKKRPSKLNAPLVNNGDPSIPLAKPSPRTPRGSRTPRSPYSKSIRFSRNYSSAYRKSARLYDGPSRDKQDAADAQ
ncbi:hypothetical protein KL951_001210 [Ogataea haglerorum]|nr:hypothetical protein KL951_001210 [Ogataea haglerorum]